MPTDKVKMITVRSIQGIITVVLLVALTGIIQNEYRKARIKTINYFMPASYQYLLAVEKDPALAREGRLREYLTYYDKILKVFPGRDDVQNMKAFCLYHLGRTDEAIAYFRQAAKLNPAFFWPHYNLGVVLFKNGRYQEAAAAFKEAMEQPPETTFKILAASRIYQAVLADTPTRDYQQEEHLSAVYNKVPILMILSYYAASGGGDKMIQIHQEAEKLQVHIF